MLTIEDLKKKYDTIDISNKLETVERIKQGWQYFKNKILTKTLTPEEFNSNKDVYNGNEHACLRYLIETSINKIGINVGECTSSMQTLWVNKNDKGEITYNYDPTRTGKKEPRQIIDRNQANLIMNNINDFLYELINTSDIKELERLTDNNFIKRNFTIGIIIVNESLNNDESLNKYRFQQTYSYETIYKNNVCNENSENILESVYKNHDKTLEGAYECAQILQNILGKADSLEKYIRISEAMWRVADSIEPSKDNEECKEKDSKEESKSNEEAKQIIIKAYNKIFYGCPGSGKSYFIKNELLKELHIKDDNVIRTTFYEDYSNSDFVGQIYPQIDNGDVTYIFKPGPFTLALKKALENRNEPVALIIEEINRGKAPSIFGEIFQLLDRDSNGNSEYSINNFNLEKYLGVNNIYIPNNLYILATMNTSDQNVFTLDNAFKRRFNLEMINNDFKEEDTIKDLYVPGLNKVIWKEFKENINNFINELDSEFISEDKQIGKYFVSGELLLNHDEDSNESKTKEFAYKVLEYLYNDIAKIIGKDKIFDSNLKTLTSVINKYIELSSSNKSLDVFSEQLKSKFSFNSDINEEQVTPNEDKVN